jgi:thiol-disulfide isomerase/thioredoxin
MPADGDLDLGSIDVPCRIGPRTGADMRAYKFTDADGQVRSVNDLQGRLVLLHVWATWCDPCLKAMPSLKASVDGHANSPLTVVGLNIDEDVVRAQAVANQQGLVWAQNYLGPDSDLMRQLAASSVPAYYLIGQDGKLVGSANQWSEIEQQLHRALESR